MNMVITDCYYSKPEFFLADYLAQWVQILNFSDQLLSFCIILNSGNDVWSTDIFPAFHFPSISLSATTPLTLNPKTKGLQSKLLQFWTLFPIGNRIINTGDVSMTKKHRGQWRFVFKNYSMKIESKQQWRRTWCRFEWARYLFIGTILHLKGTK